MSRLKVARTMAESRTIRMSMRHEPGEMEQGLKKLIDERDNDDIIKYLESQSSNSNEQFKVILHDIHSSL